MTREDLRKHCEQMMKVFERAPESGQYQEHKMVIDLLNQTEWISVTEKLPKEEPNTYWICTHNGYQCECRWTNVNPFWNYKTTDWHWNIADIPQYTKVVAWMPLPEPYETESEIEE